VIVPLVHMPGSVPFEIVFGEFLRAYPLDFNRFKNIDSTDEGLRFVIGLELGEGEPVSVERAQRFIGEQHQDLIWSQPGDMLMFFRQRLEAQDHGRIILVGPGKTPVELTPDLLRFAEPEPARRGIFVLLRRFDSNANPLAEYSGKKMLLPDDVAAAVRRTFQAPPAVPFPDPVPREMRPRPQQGASGTISEETKALKLVLAAHDRGEISIQADARKLIDPALGVNAFKRVCAKAAEARPGIWKLGRPTKPGEK
jgi:hypothetical protein